MGPLALVLLLAGCTSPPVSTPEVGLDAPSEGGAGARTITVSVSDGTGPLPAAVILYWAKDKGQWEGPVVDGDVVVLQLLGLRGTRVEGHVPADREVFVIAGAGPDWTEEWVGPLATGQDDVAVRLHPRHLGFSHNGTWGPAAVGVDLWPYVDYVAWQPTELALDADESVSRARQARMGAMTATLSWENTPTATADLGFMVASRDSGSTCWTQDHEQELAMGPHSQSFTLPYWSRCVIFLPTTVDSVDPPVDIGPATRSHLVAPFGLPYGIEAKVTLRESWGWQELKDRLGNRTIEKEWIDPVTGAPVQAPPRPVRQEARPATPSGPASDAPPTPSSPSPSATGQVRTRDVPPAAPNTTSPGASPPSAETPGLTVAAVAVLVVLMARRFR